MSRIILEGGTDTGEVALFSVDELPASAASDESLSDLVSRKQAVRMPTGADGGYLLHLYLDMEIPEVITQFCETDDILESELSLGSGRIAFGGAESAFAEFEPNPHIRSDAVIPAGGYHAVAYRTNYPDELIEEKVEIATGKDGARKLNFPIKIFFATAAVAIVSGVIGINANPLGLVVSATALIAGVGWYKSYVGSEDYKNVKARILEVQQEYPSIVVALKRNA